MAAPKGHPRYGGRQKGTLNKRSQDLIERATAIGADALLPADMILAVTRDAYDRWKNAAQIEDRQSWGQRAVEYAAKAAPYYHPTLKSVEANVRSDQVEEMDSNELAALIAATRKALEDAAPDGNGDGQAPGEE